jgi:hypothetical protein
VRTSKHVVYIPLYYVRPQAPEHVQISKWLGAHPDVLCRFDNTSFRDAELVFDDLQDATVFKLKFNL